MPNICPAIQLRKKNSTPKSLEFKQILRRGLNVENYKHRYLSLRFKFFSTQRASVGDPLGYTSRDIYYQEHLNF